MGVRRIRIGRLGKEDNRKERRTLLRSEECGTH